MNILDQSVIKKGKLENVWKNYASAVFNHLIISYFSTITGFWGKSADRRNHCSMDLVKKSFQVNTPWHTFVRMR